MTIEEAIINYNEVMEDLNAKSTYARLDFGRRINKRIFVCSKISKQHVPFIPCSGEKRVYIDVCDHESNYSVRDKVTKEELTDWVISLS